MLIILTSKAETSAVFIKLDQLTYLHACSIDNYRWDSEEKDKEPEWGIEFYLKDTETVTVKCGSKEKALSAEKHLPQYILEAIKADNKALWIELGCDDE